jgi:hypothetical protein
MAAAGDPIYAADVNERIATMTPRVADTSTVTTTETVADTITATLVNGYRYRIRWIPGYTSSVAGDSVFLRLREDSVSGTQMTVVRGYSPLTNGGGSRWVAVVEAEYTASASASKTFVGTFNRASGTGNVNIAAGATYPTLLYIERIVSA